VVATALIGPASRRAATGGVLDEARVQPGEDREIAVGEGGLGDWGRLSAGEAWWWG
jgi:hypothetical protein